MSEPTATDSVNTSAAIKLLVGADIPAVTALIGFLEKHRETMDAEVRKGFDSLWLVILRNALVKASILTQEQASWTPPQPPPKGAEPPK